MNIQHRNTKKSSATKVDYFVKKVLELKDKQLSNKQVAEKIKEMGVSNGKTDKQIKKQIGNISCVRNQVLLVQNDKTGEGTVFETVQLLCNGSELVLKNHKSVKSNCVQVLKIMMPSLFQHSVNAAPKGFKHIPPKTDTEQINIQTQISIYADIEEVKNDDNLSETEKQSLIMSRIGQGEFRKNVIKTWGLGESCPITKINIKEMLIASHIKPWRKCQTKNERLDGANGMLLCAHLDKLFDNYLLSFKKINGQYIGQLSSVLNSSQLATVGLHDEALLDTSNLNDQNLKRLDAYLEEHYDIFYKISME